MSQNPIQNLQENTIKTNVIQQAEQARFKNNLKKFRNTRYYLLGVAGVSFTLALYNKMYKEQKSQEEVEFKKSRLSQPISELTTASGTDIPWSQKNIDEWLYKPVRITGRPLHNRAVLLPSRKVGYEGYEYVVPLCTKETPEGDPIEGVFINKGFVPHEYANVACRYKIEDSFHQQTFTAYVSKLANFSEYSPLQRGNSPVLERNKWNYADLKEMAQVSGFQNKAAVGAGVLESVNLDSPLDERYHQLLDINSDFREDYPYRQTLPGALQSNDMPWDIRSRARNYFNLGLVSTFAAVLFSF